MKLSLNLIESSNDQTNLPHKSLLTDAQVSKIRKAFTNDSSLNVQFSKPQLSKFMQSGGVIRDTPILDNILSNIATKGYEQG